MDHHPSAEQLSSYLDGEIGSREAQVLEDHIASCNTCREELASLRRVVVGLRRLERPPMPPALAFRVRQDAAAAASRPRGPLQRLQILSILLNALTLHPGLRTSATMGLAVVFSLFLVMYGSEQQRPVQPEPVPPAQEESERFVVTVSDRAPMPLPQTTSEVAGREFIYDDVGRWIQRGLEDDLPVARVAARSPEGRAMLSKYSDLGLLLADGSRVVLRYRVATVELSGS